MRVKEFVKNSNIPPCLIVNVMSKRNDNAFVEKALIRKQNREIAKRNLSDWYKEFTVYHIPWMREVLDLYMSNGDMGISPLLLADRYKDPRDMEVAMFASLIVSAKDVDEIVKNCNKLAEILTDRPFIWLSQRGFVSLYDPKVRDISLFAGTTNGKFALLMQNLWGLYEEFGGIEEFCKWGEVPEIPAQALASQLQVNKYGEEKVKLGRYEFDCALILARLSRKDGIGLGLWNEPVENLYPFDARVKAFVNTFFFKNNRMFTLKEKISLMGFKDGMELFYATLAYQSLCERKPVECHRYEKVFASKLFKRRELNKVQRKELKLALPPIY